MSPGCGRSGSDCLLAAWEAGPSPVQPSPPEGRPLLPRFSYFSQLPSPLQLYLPLAESVLFLFPYKWLKAYKKTTGCLHIVLISSYRCNELAQTK